MDTLRKIKDGRRSLSDALLVGGPVAGDEDEQLGAAFGDAFGELAAGRGGGLARQQPAKVTVEAV